MPASRVTQAALLLAALVTGAAADGSADPPCGSACKDICAPTDAECTAQGVDFVPTVVDGTCVCQSPNTPVDCVYEYDACDASCVKRLTVTTAAEHGGVACPTDPELSCAPYDDYYDECCPGGEVWDVYAQSCLLPMVDCVFEYDACDSSCTKGVIVTTAAANGGQACPVGREHCSPGDSPDDACCEQDSVWDVYAGCVEQIWGCMDTAALNANPLANAPDNSQCQYPVGDCTDHDARNWNPSADISDNSLCIYDCVGDYGACAADCQKPFNVIQSPANGGTPCPELSASCRPDDDDEDACCPVGEEWDPATSACAATGPVDCVGSWGACDANCKSTYSVTTSAANGGAACPASHQAQGDCNPTDSIIDACTCASMNKEEASDDSCHDECSGTGKIFDPTGSGSCVCDPSDFPNVDNSGSCYDACAYDNKGLQLVFNPELSQCECPSDTYIDETGICVSVFQANDMEDEDFLSGVDDLGFSDEPEDHCQGGDATVSFRYQDPTDTRSFTAATLKAHLDTLSAESSVNLKVVCTFALGHLASDDFTVTIHCDDVDEDGVCDHNDACAGVQCQAFYALLPQAGSTIQFEADGDTQYNINGGTNVNIEICAGTHTVERTNGAHPLQISDSNGAVGNFILGGEQSDIAFAAGEYSYVCTSHGNMHGVITVVDCASPYTCVDTDVDTNNGDYQCQQEGHEHELCGGRGFTGSNCEVCAAGSGWNGDAVDPQCVGCADSGEKYHTDSESATEPCVLAHCAVDYGVTKDGSFNSDSAASDICVECAEGYASPAGSGHCEPKTCVKGDGIVAGTIVCDQGTVSGVTGSCGCACHGGYEGTKCDTPSACVVASAENLNSGEIACLHGGLATGTTGDCGCNCPYPWGGDRCQDDVVDDCASSPCENGGTCNDKVNDYECTCATGWEGGTCQLSVDDCVNHLCKNGAVCVDGHNDYTCSCALGWKGATCAEDANDCDPDPCNGHPCQDDGLNSYSCFCNAGYEGTKCDTPSACVVASAENLNSGEIACLHGGLATGTTGGCGCNCGDIDYSGDRCQTHTDNCDPDPCKNGATCSDTLNDYECSPARGFSGKDNDECADGKQEVSNICMTKQADGKAPAADITLVKSLHGGTAPAQRKARKQAVRDALREARKDVDDDLGGDKKKGGQQAFIWLQDYTVELDKDNDYADGSATKDKFKALPAGSKLKMVVGFDVGVDSTVVVSARPRKTKGEARDVDRVVLATPTSTAVLGIMNADDSDAIPTAKFTGNGADAGYDWKCRNDAGAWVNPDGGTTKQDGDTVECPIARAEPVARTFDVGSGEETTTACMQDNAKNYLDTAAHHDQTLCCVVDGCSNQQLSDAFAAASSGCGDNAGGHTEMCVMTGTTTAVGCDATDEEGNARALDGTCQTTQCEQAQLFDEYESRTAQCSV